MRVVSDDHGFMTVLPFSDPVLADTAFGVSVHPMNAGRPDQVLGVGPGQHIHSALTAVQYGAGAMVAGLGALHVMASLVIERAGADHIMAVENISNLIPFSVEQNIRIDDLAETINIMIDLLAEWADSTGPDIDQLVQDAYQAVLLDHERLISHWQQAAPELAQQLRQHGTSTEDVAQGLSAFAEARARVQQQMPE